MLDKYGELLELGDVVYFNDLDYVDPKGYGSIVHMNELYSMVSIKRTSNTRAQAVMVASENVIRVSDGEAMLWKLEND